MTKSPPAVERDRATFDYFPWNFPREPHLQNRLKFLRILGEQGRKPGEREARVARKGRRAKKLPPVRIPLFELFRPHTHRNWLSNHGFKITVVIAASCGRNLETSKVLATTTLTLFSQLLKGLCSPQLSQLFLAGYLNWHSIIKKLSHTHTIK